MRLGIITDIHENLHMLREALKLASVHQCDEVACLGDIVGYDHRFYNYTTERSAKKCLDLIRSNCRWVVAGNHDLHAAGKFPSFSNGLEYPQQWFAMNITDRKKASRGKVWSYDGDAPNDMTDNDLHYLQSLPEYLLIAVSGINCLFSHYFFPDFSGSTTRYIERNHHLQGHWDFMNQHGVKFSFSGHSHQFFTGFAYQHKRNGAGSFLKAIHSVPSDTFNLGNEKVAILLPPLSGDKGRTAFSIMDSAILKLTIISTSSN
jgi:predicted phosphodiesterase